MVEILKDGDKDVKVYRTFVRELVDKLQFFYENLSIAVACNGDETGMPIIDVASIGCTPTIIIADQGAKTRQMTVGELAKKLQAFNNEYSEVVVAYQGSDESSVVMDVDIIKDIPTIIIPAGIIKQIRQDDENFNKSRI
jgi:hypothetical protein